MSFAVDVQYWPPINEQRLAGRKAKKRKTMSKAFTQYLELRLHQFCKNNNVMLLREVKNLDYLICSESEATPYFFEDKFEDSLDWKVCIEAQWGIHTDSKGQKGLDDFIKTDFPKLGHFKTTKDDQYKIALANIDTNRQDVRSLFTEIIEKLSKQEQVDQKDKYLICLSSRKKRKAREYLFIHAFYDDFVESTYEETDVTF